METRKLKDLKSVGKATIEDFEKINIFKVEDLIGKSRSRDMSITSVVWMFFRQPSPRPKMSIFPKSKKTGSTGRTYVRLRHNNIVC